jgi:hypothetical protein
METLDALPDRIVEALRSASGTSASKEPAAQKESASSAGTDPQAQHESPGGKFFGYKSAAHWFAGDKS